MLASCVVRSGAHVGGLFVLLEMTTVRCVGPSAVCSAELTVARYERGTIPQPIATRSRCVWKAADDVGARYAIMAETKDAEPIDIAEADDDENGDVAGGEAAKKKKKKKKKGGVAVVAVDGAPEDAASSDAAAATEGTAMSIDDAGAQGGDGEMSAAKKSERSRRPRGSQAEAAAGSEGAGGRCQSSG